ncbi:MAG: UDP-N-acetylglucosamine--N-acetylmuramyl-(pentapeptide) pyrophosphoryl-undecaprenol N-acetylglucosamine transferase [Rhodoluna sp.]
MTNYLLAGGGTAGHVNPLLALAEKIRATEPQAKILALGTAEGLEVDLVPRRGFELRTIAKLPFPRRFNFYALKFPARFVNAVRVCQRILREENIDVLVGLGGYASAPAYLAANILKIPIVIHEANTRPGWANKLGSRFAKAIGTAFKNTPLKGSSQIGMPLRSEIEKLTYSNDKASARKNFGLKPDVTTLLVTGGSLGAKRINETIENSRTLLSAAGIQVIHIVGGNSELQDERTSDFVRLRYCNQMELAIDAADFAISRAGASTVSEFAAVGLPALFIPYPIGNGEQRFNIREIVEANGSISTRDQEFTPDFVAQNVIPLMSNSVKLAEMKTDAKSVGISNGAERLLAMVRGALN